MQNLKGKHKCFHSLCFVLYMKQRKCCKFAKYYFFYFTIGKAREGALEHASTNY